MTGQMFYYFCGVIYSGIRSAYFFAASYIFIVILHKMVKNGLKIIELDDEEQELLLLSGFENKLKKTLKWGLGFFKVVPFLYLAGAVFVEEALLVLTDNEFIIHAAPYVCGVIYLALLVLVGFSYMGKVRIVNNKENEEIERFMNELLAKRKNMSGDGRFLDEEAKLGNINSGKAVLNEIVHEQLMEESIHDYVMDNPDG